MDDWQLIEAYVQQQSEPAFGTLVERHGGLVFNSALRQVGDPQLAEDIAQAVFILLARKAKRFRRSTVVAGWLFQTTRFVAARAVRTEQRRRQREQKASEMESSTSTEITWQHVAPALDEALSRLSRADRDALLLRFFQGKSLREVGIGLGSSEAAAKKRVTRALDKLRRTFSRRGLQLSTASLATVLGTQAGAAVPASLASVHFVANAAGGSVAGLVAETLAAWRLLRWKWATAIICPTAVVVAVLVNEPGKGSRTRPSIVPELPAAGGVAASAAPQVAAVLPAPDSMRRLTLQVVDAQTGEGVPHARLAINTVHREVWHQRSDLTTDQTGFYDLSFPLDASRLDIGAFADGWETRFATWPSEGRKTFPSAHTLRLARVQQGIGGQIQDDGGRPLVSVEIWFQADGTGDSSHRERPLERFGFVLPIAVARSDAEGQWTIGFIPPEHPGFNLRARHPDFPETTIINCPQQRASEDIDSQELQQLWSGTLVTRMRAAFSLAGVVRNEEGTAIAGVQIQERDQSRVFKTDLAGQFHTPQLPAGPRAFTFSAEEYAPQRVTLEVGPSAKPTEVTLGRGAILRLRVVDEHGFSVSGATVGLEQWGEHRHALAWRDSTDSSGLIEWHSAPPDVDLELYAKKDGFAYTRDVHVKAAIQEQVIVLIKALTVHGHAVDAESGQEIPDLRAVPSYGKRYWDMGLTWQAGEAVRGTNGTFEFTFDDDRPPWQLRVVADGYDEWTSEPLTGPSPKRLEILLKPSSPAESVRGVVLRSDGAPAAGAQLALLSFEHNVQLRSSRFSGNDRWLTVSDEEGGFQFPVNRLAHSLAAVSEDGFAHQRLDHHRQPVQLILQPWGRVQGMVDASAWTHPINEIKMYDPAADNYQGRVSLHGVFSVKPDALGRFTFERVPPGDYCVFINSGLGIPYHHQTPVQVEPGQTVQVTVQEQPGVWVRGQFVAPPGRVVDWTKDRLTRLLASPGRRFSSSWETTESGMLEALNFWTSAEGRAYVNSRNQISLRVFEDGAFISVERVPPGDYILGGSFGNASVTRDLMIQDAAEHTEELDLGAVALR